MPDERTARSTEDIEADLAEMNTPFVSMNQAVMLRLAADAAEIPGLRAALDEQDEPRCPRDGATFDEHYERGYSEGLAEQDEWSNRFATPRLASDVGPLLDRCEGLRVALAATQTENEQLRGDVADAFGKGVEQIRRRCETAEARVAVLKSALTAITEVCNDLRPAGAHVTAILDRIVAAASGGTREQAGCRLVTGADRCLPSCVEVGCESVGGTRDTPRPCPRCGSGPRVRLGSCGVCADELDTEHDTPQLPEGQR